MPQPDTRDHEPAHLWATQEIKLHGPLDVISRARLLHQLRQREAEVPGSALPAQVEQTAKLDVRQVFAAPPVRHMTSAHRNEAPVHGRYPVRPAVPPQRAQGRVYRSPWWRRCLRPAGAWWGRLRSWLWGAR